MLYFKNLLRDSKCQYRTRERSIFSERLLHEYWWATRPVCTGKAGGPSVWNHKITTHHGPSLLFPLWFYNILIDGLTQLWRPSVIDKAAAAKTKTKNTTTLILWRYYLENLYVEAKMSEIVVWDTKQSSSLEQSLHNVQLMLLKNCHSYHGVQGHWGWQWLSYNVVNGNGMHPSLLKVLCINDLMI